MQDLSIDFKSMSIILAPDLLWSKPLSGDGWVVSSGWAIEYSCGPFPLTPTLSPRRGGTFACPHQISSVLTWCMAAWLPLLGERVGVRGNLSDVRTESQK